MKTILIFLAMFCSVNIFARLDVQKIAEAMVKATLKKTVDVIYYEPVNDVGMKAGMEKINASHENQIYGPYRLMLKGIAPGTRLGMYSFNLNNMEKPLFFTSGYIDKEGDAHLKKDGNDVNFVNHRETFGGMMAGEPSFSLVVLDDRQTYLVGCCVPNPIEAVGLDGRRVEMQMCRANGPCYLVQGENFKPGEEVTAMCHFEEEITTQKCVANDSGSFFFLHRRSPLQKQYVKESLLISSEEQIEPLVLEYDWVFLEVLRGKSLCEAEKICSKKNKRVKR